MTVLEATCMNCRCWSVCTCTPVRDASVLTEQQGRQMGGGSGYPQYSLSSSNRTTSNPEHHFHPVARTHNMAMNSLTRWFQTHTQQHILQFLRTARGQNQCCISCIRHRASIMIKPWLHFFCLILKDSNDIHFVTKDTHTTVFRFLGQLYLQRGDLVDK